MIVAIDGPAGAGKSSVAKRLADRLGFAFLDTGSMYRSITLACLEQGIDLQDQSIVAQIAGSITLHLDHERVWMNDRDITSEIRLPRITQSVRFIADNVQVRGLMIELQRQIALGRDIVTEGRDQGTVAFPKAECKIFLTASPEERARRRVLQIVENGGSANYDDILRQQETRDEEDRNRKVGGLRRADDAIEVITDGLSEAEVLDRLVEIVTERRASLRPHPFQNPSLHPDRDSLP